MQMGKWCSRVDSCMRVDAAVLLGGSDEKTQEYLNGKFQCVVEVHCAVKYPECTRNHDDDAKSTFVMYISGKLPMIVELVFFLVVPLKFFTNFHFLFG